MRRLRFLMWKELLELRQDPRLFGIVIVAPILQLTMLGYAATTDVQERADRRRRRRSIAGEPRARSPLRGVAELHDRRRRSRSVDDDRRRSWSAARAWLALAIPADYHAAHRRRPTRPIVQVIADGTDANSTERRAGLRAATSSRGYAQELVSAAARRLAAAPAPPSRRASASGSTRSSRAATS